MNANFKVIGSTQLGIKPEFTALEADALTTRPFELLNMSRRHHFPLWLKKSNVLQDKKSSNIKTVLVTSFDVIADSQRF